MSDLDEEEYLATRKLNGLDKENTNMNKLEDKRKALEKEVTGCYGGWKKREDK